ncbi:MAG: peptide-methionine (R)-S-oxide reductase MsrB [Planctomycetota bacterium]
MTDASSNNGPDRTELSPEEWRARLTPEQYRVTREAGTEPPGTGEYCDTKTAGTYHCICCDTPLFRSNSKFDSGCGWPSFFEPLEGANLIERRDGSHGMIRTEILCAGCDAHLGHVFPDGPPPTGIRYCINSVCLKLDADE